MKKNIILISAVILFNNLALAAGGDSGSSSTKVSMYDEAVKLIKRAGKLEKKNNSDKAIKLYKQAFSKLEKADKKDKNNPDILNYMGFTSRKSGNFDEAEMTFDTILLWLNITPFGTPVVPEVYIIVAKSLLLILFFLSLINLLS